MLTLKNEQRGVTLIEVMIAIVVTAILLAVGVPSFNVWVQNSKIRTATESIVNGLQLARAEAVRRNEQVNFILGAGTSWTVQTVAVPIAVLQNRASSEGSSNVTVVATPLGATTVTFNELGRIVNPSTAPTRLDIDVPPSVLPASQSRELRIEISVGGQIRSCDPTFTGNDPRAC